jgi:D-psicose/D-tagatose/L-ribulose 3-epimerase
MRPQSYEQKNIAIREAFLGLARRQPDRLRRRLALSWSNWGFGIEPLASSAARLQRAGIRWIELHGNHYGPDLGYRPAETLRTLGEHGIAVAGICGMFSADNDLSSNRAVQRQAAIDYIRRELDFAAEVKAGYLLVVPGAVGRPQPYDATEFERSVESLRLVAELFVRHRVRAAVEPIRSDEVSFCHTVEDAKRYIEAVGHPGVGHINGDLYHMQAGEGHIGEAIQAAGAMLTNLHLADSNRRALGLGSLDIDTVIRALYLVGFNEDGRYVTPEPLGPGANPYPAMHGRPDPRLLEDLVQQTARCFREREEAVLSEA